MRTAKIKSITNMMFYTHLAFSFLVGLTSSKVLGVKQQLLFIALICLFGVIPDIDNHKSRVGKKIPVTSFMIALIFRHRGIFHSLLIPIGLYLILLFLNFTTIATAVFIGYVSHLVLDAFTDSGVRLLWPLSFRIRGFIKTNSIIEKLIFLVLLALNMYTLFLY